MKTINPLVELSVLIIRKVWHGKIGRTFNSKKNIICRFHPSCSNYGIRALRKHGFVKGWIMTINRISRCRPDNHESTVDFP